MLQMLNIAQLQIQSEKSCQYFCLKTNQVYNYSKEKCDCFDCAPDTYVFTEFNICGQFNIQEHCVSHKQCVSKCQSCLSCQPGEHIIQYKCFSQYSLEYCLSIVSALEYCEQQVDKYIPVRCSLPSFSRLRCAQNKSQLCEFDCVGAQIQCVNDQCVQVLFESPEELEIEEIVVITIFVIVFVSFAASLFWSFKSIRKQKARKVYNFI
ncbi:Hypothetical_protein [Hexamita inflata]|uniref:Hypothetical_protein n=1 Tax=Hexamita inflata TaxID=28002 RepID=A0ABP1JEB2_9EUKA